MIHDNWNRGELIHTKRKTPKQREILKKLNLRQKNLLNKASIAEKNLKKFENENEKIISKWKALNYICEQKDISWSNAYDTTTDYEEKFKVYSNKYDRY
tara:strand:- start:49 stop:345 length:297 start_codon:yes stop_codon:yes gene_type:complete